MDVSRQLGQVPPEFGRGDHLDLQAEPQQLHRRLAEPLGRQPRRHPAITLRWGLRASDSLRPVAVEEERQQALPGRRQSDRRLAGVHSGVECLRPRPPERDEVEVRWPLEPGREQCGRDDPCDPVGPWRAVDRRDRVPDAALEHEPERRDRPVDLSGPALIPPRELALLPDRLGDQRQERQIVLVVIPAGRVEMEPRPDPLGPVPQRLGQRCQQLELGRRHRLAQAEVGGDVRRPGQEQRVGLVRRQAGQPRPVTVEQPKTTVRTPVRHDRDAGQAEGIDVAVDGTDRDLEFGRQLGTGEPPPVLKEQDDRQQPARPHPPLLTSCRGHPACS